jgi:hypothetical protein
VRNRLLALALLALQGQTMTTEAASNTASSDLAALCRASDGAWVGEVLSVGAPPKMFSGVVAALQPVTYRVKETIKGPTGLEQVQVSHAVVQGSESAEPSDRPALSASRFAVGALLIVMAQRNDRGQWVALDERHGAVPLSPQGLAEVKAQCR